MLLSRPGPRRAPTVTAIVLYMILALAFAYTSAAAPSESQEGLASGTTSDDTDQTLTSSSSADAILKPRANLITPGSLCPDSEGQWNCLGTSWQRCASGRWSVEMQCAAGTRCVPDGRTYDFRIQATGNNGGSGAQYATAKAARSLRVGWPGSGGAWNAPGGAGAWEERVGRVSFLVGVAAFVAWWGMA